MVSSGSDSILRGIFPGSTDHSEKIGLKTDFKPWHKIRKQWVRRFHWINNIETLCNNLRFEDGQPLKYLCLPGTDMLDLRFLHGWCKTKEKRLKFLGYNDPCDSSDSGSTELNLSQAELTQREFIDGSSSIVSDKFERIGDKDSVAYAKLTEMGSFDVINLDLCNSVAGYIPLEKQDDYYNAISNIVQFQKLTRTQPWLLFITTRANRSSVKAEAEAKLIQHIKNNARSHSSFNSKFTECFGSDPNSIRVDSERIYFRLFGLALAKWLLSLLFDGQPKWCIKLLNCGVYKVNNSTRYPDMLSLAFECSLIINSSDDRVGLAIPAGGAPQIIEEIEFANVLIDGIRRYRNIDSTVSDPTLRNSLINEAAPLMKDARYNETQYRRWAEHN